MHNLLIPRNTRFLRTRFYIQECPSSNRVLQPYFKSSKGISSTSLRRGVLNMICHHFFPTIHPMQENKEMTTNKLHTRNNFLRSSTKNSFFWFRSSGFHKQPVLFEVLAPASIFLQGSHMQRQYHKRTTLRSKISTIKGLLYAPDPDNRKKGTLSDKP